jgi:uncharacterized membrane protein YeiH
MPHSEALLLPLSIIGLIAASMTAALAAGRRSMDWVGVALLGCVTALGGGSTRDVLIGNYPLSWVQEPFLLAITTAAALGTIALSPVIHRLRNLFFVLDAVGLVAFTILGCDVALKTGQHPAIVIVAGMITGCVGGVLRDVLCNDVPLLFRSELYASVSIVTGLIYVGGLHLDLSPDLVTLVALGVGLAFRLLAIRYRWEMPKFVYERD